MVISDAVRLGNTRKCGAQVVSVIVQNCLILKSEVVQVTSHTQFYNATRDNAT